MELSLNGFFTKTRLLYLACGISALILSHLSQPIDPTIPMLLLRYAILIVSFVIGYRDGKHPTPKPQNAVSFKLQSAKLIFGKQKYNWWNAILVGIVLYVNFFYLNLVGFTGQKLLITTGSILMAMLAGKLWYKVSPPFDLELHTEKSVVVLSSRRTKHPTLRV
ncbi:MAG: hypothetical protein OEM52_06660 [bacterium]|nr:hypothetical protein [bacterium]